ncbi:sodium:solute symporter family protein [Amycolatopsis rubida]|uniref:Sodium:solute symporter family protein n=1 Tax=Amycolatopsis rubida TaxID=112413 RepID=A0A1I6B8D1_9PSEU|nr:MULTISPECIES: SSS family transporter [Amycolatopsis]MYW93057.1 sodium:solute symporter family protein [Amycolatopsis rubida]NEC58044.1 sodium:solute symporter family protein [Amycolatopsis rubida]OAP20970.1 putative symporter YodF [Amycolatopsis sp. M39]SFQ77165.1 solute:Na+ symporter, SSS family [Amycolatopsis rubida]
MLILIVAVVMGLSILLALWAGRSARGGGISEFLVGGRSFPPWLLYFLAVGEVYSIGTMIGFPSGIYAHGASYGIWFLGYILLAYSLGYFLAPLVWRAARKHDAMTVPDVFGRHYGSRTLELITCVTMLIALVPWGQYQFIGLQVVLSNLGLNLTPVQCVILAGIIAFAYIAVSGIRSPAFVSILKDAFMLLGVVLVGLAAVLVAGGTSGVTGPAALARAQTTMGGQDLWFAMTTILFQSVVFYLGFGGAYVFPARSERAVKSSTVWMPLYMLIYPFLVFAAYYGLKQHPGLKNPNTVFMVTAKGLLPEPVLGLVAAGAALSGVLVLSATALAIGGMVSRNLAPNVRPAAQRRWTVVAVAVFLVLAAVLTLTASTLMLTVLNLTYNLLAQVVPGWLAILFARRVRTAAIATGMVVGVVTAVVLYATGVTLGGLNTGLVSMGVNLLIVFGWSLLAPGRRRSPIALESGTGVAASPAAAAAR